MSKKKPNKNSNSTQQVKQKQPRRVESSTCEKCNMQCEEYLNYIKNLKPGKLGKGVTCRKQ